MNIVKKNNIIFKYESYWRESKNDMKRDSNDTLYPYPKEGEPWTAQNQFTHKLSDTQHSLQHRFKKYDNAKNCLLCDVKNVTTGFFNLNNMIWEDGLEHYITAHNIKPSSSFIDLIYKYSPTKRGIKRILKFNSTLYNVNDMKYIKLDRNQILIMDALMKHGGYTKKYVDKNNNKIYRYSEHAGLLDFNESGLEKIIISGKTNRVDQGDDEIYLPKNMKDAIDYEYIFHTHPPTPKPGGRADVGILYEVPSISDIFHFIDHFNKGTTQGSLVIASEGLYNIRKLAFDRNKLKINEDKMYSKLKKVYATIQKEGIEKFGHTFTTYTFYSKIAQDTKFINDLNKVLNTFELHIDYFPRIKDTSNKWIVDTIHLPVFVTEPI